MSDTTVEQETVGDVDPQVEYPLGPDGPHRDTIEEWKAHFAPSQIHAFPMADEEEGFKFIIIRTITRSEFVEVQLRQAKPDEFDEWLISEYVLFPAKDVIMVWAEEAAGTILTIGEQIFKKSGFRENVPSIRL